MNSRSPTPRDQARDIGEPGHDDARLAALQSYGILDTQPEQAFDDIALIASQVCQTPTALVSFVESDRQWFKARVGFDPRQTPLSQSICAHGLGNPGLLVIPDLTADPRTRDNMLVIGEPRIRFYAGARLETPDGVGLGMLCVIDTVARPEGLSTAAGEALIALAGQVMAQLELRRAVRERAAALAERQASEAVLGEALAIAELGTYEWTLDSDVVTLDDRARAIFGFNGDDLVTAERIMALMPAEDERRVREAITKAVAAGQPFENEYAVTLSGGETRTVSSLNKPRFDSSGTVIGYVGVFSDTTEQRAAKQTLRESETRFSTLVRASSEVLYAMSPDWGEMRQLSGGGFLADTAANPNWLAEYIHPDDQAEVQEAIAAAIQTRSPFRFEHRVRLANGSLGWTESRAAPIFDAQGNITEWFGAASDITATRRAEVALRETEANLRALNADLERQVTERALARGRTWQLSPELMGVLNSDGYFEQSNPAWAKVLGWSEAEVASTSFFDFIHLDDLPRTQAAYVAAIEREEPALRFENRYRIKAGGWRWLSWVAVPDKGKVYCSARDVTEEKAQEAALAERTAERDRMWDTSPDLMVLLGTDGVFRRVNPAWKKVLGYDDDDLIGTRVDRLVHPEDVELTERALAAASAGPLPIVENRYRHKDGSCRWISWVAAPAGELIYATGRHITAEREAAEALARAEGQLRQAQKMEAVGQLTGGIAHDFNNLLTGIIGSLELMQIRMAQGRAGDVGRYVMAAQGAAKRAAALTHRLLAFSRRQTLAPKPTDVKALVNGMEDMISRSVGPGIEIEVVHAAGLWPSLIDPSQLENAVLNLCINARDAMPDGGKITIETCNRWMDPRAALERGLEPGQYISLCVSDTGTGMTPDVVAKVFEPFFTTKPIGMGTGLGLSMIYGFAKQSGGTVSVYSELGQGTLVCVYLPRHAGAAEAQGDRAEPNEAPRAEAGETVLVVDDEPTVRMLVADVLTDLGYTAIEAGDGAAGLKIINSDVRVDLLVTDVGLPGGMTGRQVADAARAARPELKVLFITGYAENAVLSHGHLDPGMHVLTKPFAMEALASRIRELIAG